MPVLSLLKCSEQVSVEIKPYFENSKTRENIPRPSSFQVQKLEFVEMPNYFDSHDVDPQLGPTMAKNSDLNRNL